jgi:hypothetical protein
VIRSAVARLGRRNGHLAADCASLAKFRCADRPCSASVERFAAEVVARHRVQSSAHASIRLRVTNVRELAATETGREWPESAVVEVVDAEGAEFAARTAPPRMAPIARSKREPAKRAETTEPIANSKAAAETEERNVGRSPDGVVTRIHRYRSWPPDPVTTINEPAAIVIRRPAPRLIGDPRPAVIWLVDPSPGTIRSPIRRGGRTPHGTVVGNLGPRAVVVEVFRTGVVVIRVVP